MNLTKRILTLSKIIGLLLVFPALFQSCKREVVVPVTSSEDYFPDVRGKWVIYDVDSIYHGVNDNNNDDSVYYFHFQIREITDSIFYDGQGRANRVVQRYRRNNSTEDWNLVAVWTQFVSLSGAYRMENNVYYHKLAFPVNATTSWNGNDANTLGEEVYEYSDFHVPATVGNLDFDSTLTVLQIDEDNYVQKIFGEEIYATGVGMIFKQRDELGKRNGVVVSGLEYKETVNDFGSQ